MRLNLLPTLLGSLALVTCSLAVAQDQTPQQRVFAIKATLGASKQALLQYQWVETAAVSLNGEQKSQQVNSCSYGPDGTVQKVPIASSPPPATKPGLRGKIIADEKAKMEAYLKDAVALMRSYAPPDPMTLQAVVDAGNLTIQPQPNQAVRLTFANYQHPGDSLGINVDLTDNRLQGASVASYMGTPDQAVTLAVTWGVLPNGISYVSSMTLNAPAKNLMVNVQNSNYSPAM